VYSPVLGKIQAKLTVNTPGEQDEREAEAVAERVLRMPIAAAGDLGDKRGTGQIREGSVKEDEIGIAMAEARLWGSEQAKDFIGNRMSDGNRIGRGQK
jgi:hypothetical protein